MKYIGDTEKYINLGKDSVTENLKATEWSAGNRIEIVPLWWVMVVYHFGGSHAP